MNIKVTVDTKELVRRMGDLARRAPHAISRAINDTALSFQKEQRAHQARVFTIRRKTFMDNAVKIKKFANPNRPDALVMIDPPGGQARAGVIEQHEGGGTKLPIKGSGIAVPVDAKRGRTGVVYNRNRPSRLNLKPTNGNRRVMKGDRRTFLVRDAQGKGVLLQRFGRKGKTSVRILYLWTPRAKLKPRLHFAKNAERVIKRDLPMHLQKGIDQAIERARKA